MELDDLRYFKTVAQTLSFTGAAEKLHITQPAVSKAIFRLEQEFGVPLFDRSGKKIQLNYAGQTLLREAEKIFENVDICNNVMTNLKSGIHGRLRIGTTIPVGDLPVEDFSKLFFAENPNVAQFFYIMAHSEICERLQQYDLDVGFSYSSLIFGRNLTCELISSEYIGVVCAKSHQFAGRTGINISELANERWLLTAISRDPYFDDVLKLMPFTPNVVYRGDAAFTGEAVAHGYGISLSTETRWRKYSKNTSRPSWESELCFVPLSDIALARNIYLLSTNETPKKAAVQNWISAFRTYLSGNDK